MAQAEDVRFVEENAGGAIQAAIDSLPAGGRVVLPPGEYLIESSIRLPDGLALRGAGPDQTTLALAPDAICHILVNDDPKGGNQNIEISGLSLVGNGVGEKPSNIQELVFCCGLVLRRVTGVTIRNVTAEHLWQSGLHFNLCQHVRIEDFACSSVGWSGISTSGTDGLVILDTEIVHAGLDVNHSGIHLDGGVGAYVEATVRSCTGNAIMLDDTFSPLRHCVVHAVGTHSKRGLGIVGKTESDLSLCFVSGTYSNNREVGVLISNASHVFVHDADIRANGDCGVRLQGRSGAVECVVSRTTFAGNPIPIQEADASRDNHFFENVFLGEVPS